MKNQLILIVDDNVNMCITLQDILEDEGYEILLAHSGQQALEIISNQDPGVIITDLKMPHMDGLELLQAVKSRYPSIEIIIMTAAGEVNSYLDAMKGGAHEYITKPVNPAILKTMIAKILQQ